MSGCVCGSSESGYPCVWGAGCAARRRRDLRRPLASRDYPWSALDRVDTLGSIQVRKHLILHALADEPASHRHWSPSKAASTAVRRALALDARQHRGNPNATGERSASDGGDSRSARRTCERSVGMTCRKSCRATCWRATVRTTFVPRRSGGGSATEQKRRLGSASSPRNPGGRSSPRPASARTRRPQRSRA